MLNKMNLAKALSQYRLTREWTYRQMATASGVALGTIHEIINKGKEPSELTRHKLYKRLPGLCDGEQLAATDRHSESC
jgi:hypothetical protein